MVFTNVKNEISLKCCERKMDIEQKSLLKSFLPKKLVSLFVVFKRLVNKIDQTKFAVLETSSF